MQELRIASGVHALSFSADGRFLAVSGAGGPVQVTDLADGTATPLSWLGVWTGVAFAPRGDLLAIWGEAAEVSTWSGAQRSVTPLPDLAGVRMLGAVAFHPSGDRVAHVAPAFDTPTLDLIDFADAYRAPRRVRWNVGPARANGMAWSPDGEWIAIRGEIFEPHSCWPWGWLVPAASDLVRTERLSLRQRAYALAFRPDSAALAFATFAGVFVYSVPGDEELHRLAGHRGLVTGVAYTPDGRLLSCGTDSFVRTWDGHSGRPLDAHDWEVGPLTALTVAPDGMRAAVGSKDGRIFIWDID